MAENGARRIHTDSMYVVTIWRRVMKFLRARSTLTAAQRQTARNRWQDRVAAPNNANHDLVDRLQDCVESRGEVHIQKVKGTHNVEEAMAGEWPEDRIGNLNADAAANRAQTTSRPNLQEADEMVSNWKKRIKEHRELLSMLLDVSKAVTSRQKGIAHALANPLENLWMGKWPRGNHRLQ